MSISPGPSWEQVERDALEAQLRADHPDVDRRVLELTKLAVAKIYRAPSLVRTGLANIERWARANDGYLAACHAE